LIVVGALGQRGGRGRWLLGSIADRVAQASPVPVLVIRDPAPLVAWADGARALRILVGAELASTAKAALRFASSLRALGPCEVLVAHVAFPPAVHQRHGIPGATPLDHLRPEAAALLERDFRDWMASVPELGEAQLVLSAGWGRVDSHLAQLAEEHACDLLVVGTHQHGRLARFWQGSVSRGVLHAGQRNVACVPRGADAAAASEIPTYRRILVPTDLSALGERALRHALALVEPGGHLHVLHVVDPARAHDDDDLRRRLRAQLPAEAAARGVTIELELVAGEHPGVRITQAANRVGADAICMSTHGHSGLGRLFLGSEAQTVLERARQPVLLIPPEREP
jgi:nucleotide-binding universal stress UspA family protein